MVNPHVAGRRGKHHIYHCGKWLTLSKNKTKPTNGNNNKNVAYLQFINSYS